STSGCLTTCPATAPRPAPAAAGRSASGSSAAGSRAAPVPPCGGTGAADGNLVASSAGSLAKRRLLLADRRRAVQGASARARRRWQRQDIVGRCRALFDADARSVG